MKKHALIILTLSALALSGCTTSKQVQAMIDENNLTYDAEIDRLKSEQQATQTQIKEARSQWAETLEKLERIRISTKALEEARKNLLNYCRQHSNALDQFIRTFESIPIDPTQPAPESGVTNITPDPVY